MSDSNVIFKIQKLVGTVMMRAFLIQTPITEGDVKLHIVPESWSAIH